VGATLDGLLGALFCGLDVRHGIGLLRAGSGPARSVKEPRILAASGGKVKGKSVPFTDLSVDKSVNGTDFPQL
jgi:hypothetical protein